MKNKYYLKAGWQDKYTEATKEEFIKAERAAGFRSKFGRDHLATGGFSDSSVRGRIEFNLEKSKETMQILKTTEIVAVLEELYPDITLPEMLDVSEWLEGKKKSLEDK